MCSHVSGADGQLADGAGEESASIPCFRCGVCCTDFQVRLSLAEARGIADRLGLGWDEFQSRFADPRWPGAESFVVRQRRGACVFLRRERNGDKTSCRIHAFKPSTCREWMPGLARQECRVGLARLGFELGPPAGCESAEEKLPDADV